MTKRVSLFVALPLLLVGLLVVACDSTSDNDKDGDASTATDAGNRDSGDNSPDASSERDSGSDDDASAAPQPVDCVLSEWSEWSECDATCDGEQTRTRTVVTNPANGGTDCGELSEERDCDKPDCCSAATTEQSCTAIDGCIYSTNESRCFGCAQITTKQTCEAELVCDWRNVDGKCFVECTNANDQGTCDSFRSCIWLEQICVPDSVNPM